MLVEFLFSPIGSLIGFVLDLLPNSFFDSNNVGGLISLVSKSFVFVPIEAFSYLIFTITQWYIIHLTWAIIEWIYVKIPGVS